MELITEELNTLYEEILMIKEVAEIKGIGMAIAISFVAEIGDIRRFKSVKQVEKYEGLALKENSSVKHKGLTKISKRGRKKNYSI